MSIISVSSAASRLLSSDVAPVVVVAACAAACGFFAAAKLVRRDLAPAAGLRGPRQVLLAGALTFGVVAVAIKVVLMVALANARSLAPAQIARDYDAAPADLVAAVPAPQDWRALPLDAFAVDPAVAALGRALFHEPALSRDGSMSCASCHDLDAKAGADARRVAVGVGGAEGTRNTPTVYNAAFQTRLFWDGRASSLEEQALGPILNPIEMATPSIETALERLDAAGYAPAFARAFGPQGRLDAAHLARALADFERTLTTPDTRYDRFVRGEADALDERERRGMARFWEIGCVRCHSGPNFSGASRFEPRLPFMALLTKGTRHEATLGRDKGRAPADADNGVFRVPSLRNVAVTGPYLHDGSVDDLAETVRIMAEIQARAVVASAATPRPAPAWLAQERRFEPTSRRVVTPDDVDDIVAFLRTLTGARLAGAASR